jgi:hypothetical protein
MTGREKTKGKLGKAAKQTKESKEEHGNTKQGGTKWQRTKNKMAQNKQSTVTRRGITCSDFCTFCLVCSTKWVRYGHATCNPNGQCHNSKWTEVTFACTNDAPSL